VESSQSGRNQTIPRDSRRNGSGEPPAESDSLGVSQRQRDGRGQPDEARLGHLDRARTPFCPAVEHQQNGRRARQPKDQAAAARAQPAAQGPKAVNDRDEDHTLHKEAIDHGRSSSERKAAVPKAPPEQGGVGFQAAPLKLFIPDAQQLWIPSVFLIAKD
jgi:hypothetical protein